MWNMWSRVDTAKTSGGRIEMARDDIIQPLCPRADGRAHQRILIKLAYALSQELNKKERLKKSGREVE